MGLEPVIPMAPLRATLWVVILLLAAPVDARITKVSRAAAFGHVAAAGSAVGAVKDNQTTATGRVPEQQELQSQQQRPARKQLWSLAQRFASHIPAHTVFLENSIRSSSGEDAAGNPDQSIPQLTVKERIVNASVYVLFVGLLAYLYHSRLLVQYPASDHVAETQEDQKGFFHFSLFDTNGCFDQDRKLCCLAWLGCSNILWADTMSQEKLTAVNATSMSFWFALLFPTTAIVANILLPGWGSLLFLIVAVYFRQRLRKAYGLNLTLWSGATDVLTWCFCAPCAVVQEARQVKYLGPKVNALVQEA